MKGLSGWAKCPGTCGEWVQGTKDGIPFLIGCPVNRFVEAKADILFAQIKENHYVQQELKGWIWELPLGKEKTRLALQQYSKHHGLPYFTARIHMESQLQTGKGMASSTADMVAAVSALANALGITCGPEELANLVLGIEPTDPIMFEGVTEFAHQDGSYIKSLGPKIPAQLLMLDWGGLLDTQAFNARKDLPGHYRKNEQKVKRALSLFYEGMAERDLGKIAQASTISAQCNQEINPKPHFTEILNWILAKGGLGVITAHSGTLLAGVFPAHLTLTEQKVLLRESYILFRPDWAEWTEISDGGIKGGVEVARRKFVGSDRTVWETNIY